MFYIDNWNELISKRLTRPKEQSRMKNPEIRAKLGTRHKDKHLFHDVPTV